MGNRFFRTIFAAVALLAAAVLLAQENKKTPSTPQETEDLKKKKLETIQKEINALRQEASRLSDQENSVLAQLSQFEVQYQIQTHEVELLKLKQEKTESEIQSLLIQNADLQKNLKKQKQYLTTRLVEAYKLGELNYLKLLLKVNQSADLLRSYQYITYLVKDDGRKVQTYRNSVVDLDQTRLRLEQEKQNLEQLKLNMTQAHASVNKARQEKLRLLSSIRGEKSLHMNAMADLKQAANQLDQLFEGAKPPQPPPSLTAQKLSIARLKGNLDWPVAGRITRQFGIYKHPRFGTTTMSNGVEISAPQGADVRAVYDGQVVFAEWFKGYGQSVILSHTENYYTLYAHNSELLVRRGQSVQRAQTIAKVGSTGALEGKPSLYFEVRKKDQPVNPVEWLRRR